MKDRILNEILNRSYRFPESKDELETVKAIHDGTFESGGFGDPNFHCYAAVLNAVGEFATQALDSPHLSEFNNILADAQEEYMPGYPPMSPVTTSFFHAWMTLDVPIAPGGPTIGKLFGQWLRDKNSFSYLWKALDNLNRTYSSFYEVMGVGGDETVQLSDILEQRVFQCWNSSGYSGRTGELWYVRVLPPSLEGAKCSVTVSTPYVFRNESRESVETFFRRCSSKDASFDVVEYLKHGAFPHYWLEYVFQAYVDHTGEAIYVEGLPDDAAGRPHADGGKDL